MLHSNLNLIKSNYIYLISLTIIVLKMKKDSGYDWSKNQVDALTSFTHNLGAGNLKKLTENGTRGDEEISDMLLEYKYAGGKVREGLIKRREAELKLFNEGY